MNQSSNFLGGSFTNKDNARAQIYFRREKLPHNLKRRFSSRADPSVFTSMTPELVNWTNKTN